MAEDLGQHGLDLEEIKRLMLRAVAIGDQQEAARRETRKRRAAQSAPPQHFVMHCETQYGWRAICVCGWATDGHRSRETAAEEGNVHRWQADREAKP